MRHADRLLWREVADVLRSFAFQLDFDSRREDWSDDELLLNVASKIDGLNDRIKQVTALRGLSVKAGRPKLENAGIQRGRAQTGVAVQ